VLGRSPTGPQPDASGRIGAGVPLPLGAHQRGDGVNFAVFSRHATSLQLELYDLPEDTMPREVLELSSPRHRTGDIWHVWVRGIQPGQLYAYRADGPYAPAEGQRFNPHSLLLDPYATAITHLDDWDFRRALAYDPASTLADLARSERDDAGDMPKCIFTQNHFDWEDYRPLNHPLSETIIYETHVRGLTIHPSSGTKHPGTYRGLAEKIPYLLALGVTAVELMPVQEFNEDASLMVNPLTGERLKEYWGYNPVCLRAPKASYSSDRRLGRQNLEFKEMVKACHRAGLEVLLDVVFNHTAEGNELGPTLSLRGLDNSIYYMLAEDKRRYKNFSGTGNTVLGNHPVVLELILDALRYWVMEMHVDGFRFDLASVLARDRRGELLPNAPILERIAQDPIVRGAKIIAEAWDAGGAYQVGRFSEGRWAEWNGYFRDDVRRFWRGDEGLVGVFASRIAGSSDHYQSSGKSPESSINFVTSHDGFTLNDLVSYCHKHNEGNGEGNRDGLDENFSDSYGAEGGTTDGVVEEVRQRQIKNFLLTLFISRGVPMLLGGDEFRRTQLGNNNAYCQDNPISWYDWSLLDRHRDIWRFTRGMIAFRKAHPVLSRGTFYTDDDLRWFDAAGTSPDWFDPHLKQLACLIFGEGQPDLYLMFNASVSPVRFALPPARGSSRWRLAVDTSRTSPGDLLERGHEILLEEQRSYLVDSRTSVILVTGA